MSKELFVTSTPHETKLAVVEDDQLVEVFFERENEYTLAGSIYKGRVTRVLPGMQSAFVDIGLERDAFLYVTDFLEEVEDDDLDAGGQKPQQQSPQAPSQQHSHSHQNEPRRAPRNAPPRLPEPPPGSSTIEGDFTGEESQPQEFSAAPGGGENPQEDADADRGGARRWRGRRGRRRGGRGGQRTDAPAGSVNTAGAGEGGESHGVARDRTEEEGGGNSYDHAENPREAREEVSGNREAAGSSAMAEAREKEDSDRHAQHFNRDAEQPGSGRSREFERQPREARPPQRQSGGDRPKPQRIQLPGESLAKYKRSEGAGPAKDAEAQKSEKTEQRASSTKPAQPSIRPSTEVSAPAAFLSARHGVLAGESLAKYRNRPETAEAAGETGAAEKPQSQRPQIEQPQSSPAFAQEEQARPRPKRPEPDMEVRQSHGVRFQEEEPLPSIAAATEQVEAEPESAQDRAPARDSGHDAHAFNPGQGVIEEEEIEEEEQDFAGLGENLDDAEFEELEEETLDHDKEAEVIAAGEGLAAAFAETIREGNSEAFLEEDMEDEEGDDLEEEDSAEGEEGGEFEEAELLAEDGGEGEGIEEGQSPDSPDYAGRAEVRGSAGNAGFQQRTSEGGSERGPERGSERRPDRGGRGGRVRRTPGRRPPMRGRRNITRGPMPQINELLKEGQEILVQIAKEPMAKKGARITSHIALPGRFLVFMPTVNHTGVSRKIGSEEERMRLKRILISEKGENHGGFIVRTAASGASEEDLRADIRFLLNLWTEIKGRSETGKAPALIYHDLNLVERILRDQVTGTFSQIWVDSEQEYERILRFASRFQPSLVKRVKLYTKETPLFEQFNVQEELNKALKSKVWLKSGGYIVINQTEALVAIDINTGKYVGKTSRLEDTIVKTNIDAIKEIVRQIRLRDLGGIIIIDFIDMDERRNRQKVMQALEEALRSDRSPSKVLQFNDFGLVAITRKRVKQSLERTLGTQCTYCSGTGMIKSVATVCNEIYVEMRKMARHFDQGQVMLRVHPEVAKALKENTGRWLVEMEEMIGRTIIVKSDPAQHQEQFDIN